MQVAISKSLGCAACALFVVAMATSVSAADVPSAADILSGTIFDRDEIERVLAGKKVTTPVREVSKREIGAGHACLVPTGRKASLVAFRNADPLMPEKYRDGSGAIDVGDLRGSFASLTFGKGAESEAKRLLEIEPGYEFNLSEAEMRTFTSLKPEPGREVEAVEEQLGQVLAERVRSYRDGGTVTMAPFARARGKTDLPGDELRRTTEGMDGLKKAFPVFHQALLEYPHGSLEHDREEYWFWTRIRVLGRPVFMVHQRLAAQKEGAAVVVERQIYASHFLDVGQTVSATLPVEEGTLFFNINRTWVDRWTGPGLAVGAKRKVGTKLIASVLAAQVDELRLCEGQ